MRKHRKSGACAVLLFTAVVALAVAASAGATLTGSYADFAQCPYANKEVNKCVFSVTESGEVVLGNKKVPIVNPVTLQGGYGIPIKDLEGAAISRFYGATNGATLSQTPQPVPGGLAGIVECGKVESSVLRMVCALTFENGLTGVSATLELAKPASAIRISENNLAAESGSALELPVRVHLKNPILGSSCYVGSSSSPLIWKLISGRTKPPAPNKPITGAAGIAEFVEEGRIVVVKGSTLVDNAWSAPSASGCGGALSFLITPMINAQLGSRTAGHNAAALNSTISLASALAVSKNNEANQ